MPFFTLRTSKSASFLSSPYSCNAPPSNSSVGGEEVPTTPSKKDHTPKFSKSSPRKTGGRKIIEEEEPISVEPTPLHPILHTPTRRGSRTSSLISSTSPQLRSAKLSSSFSPTNKPLSNLNQYARKRSNSMDSTELA